MNTRDHIRIVAVASPVGVVIELLRRDWTGEILPAVITILALGALYRHRKAPNA